MDRVRRTCAVILVLIGAAMTPNAADTFIKVSPNGRYFLDKQGAPWFFQGDTEWELFRKFTPATAKELLDKRVSQGFNAFLIMLNGVPDGNDGIAGTRPWLNNNPLTPSETYFKHVDSILALCATYNAVFILGVYHKAEAQYFNLQSARSYAKFVATRYTNIPNIIWCSYPEAKSSFTSIVREVAAGLQEGDGGSHLITVHPDPGPTSSSFMHAEPWLAFNICQTFSSDFVNYTLIASDYAKNPAKPAVNGEARYEDADGTSALDIRHGAWWSYLAGGSYCYGHTQNWENPTNWKNWVATPGAAQMTVLGQLMRSLTWWKLTPDQTIVSGSANQRAAARSSDGDWALVYLPASGTVTVVMSKLTGASTVDASWINPTTGAATAIGAYANTGTRTFTPPTGWADAVLMLRAKETTPAGSMMSARTPAAAQRPRVTPARGPSGMTVTADAVAVDVDGTVRLRSPARR